MIFAPENSIIQFPESEILQSCNIVMSQCLPVNRSGDLNFQIRIDDVEAAPDSNAYVMKLFRTCDIADVAPVPVYIYGGDEETWATIEWSHLDDEGESVGFMTQTNPDFDFGEVFEDGECFRIGIVAVNGDAYVYDNFYGVTGTDVTIKLVINGVEQTLGIFDYSNGEDIADAIRSYISDNVTVLVAVNTNFISITIHAISGNTYGNFTLGATVYSPDIEVNVDDLVACSNCFIYKADPCFTMVLKYRNNENAFGFEYELDTDFYNIVRVGLYIDMPQPLVNENVFRYSDGTHKMLSATFQKEYEGHVDWYDEQRHFAIAVALKHDILRMGNDDSRLTAYVSEGAYEIAWQNKPGHNFEQATAKFKVKETPFYEVNSNCAS